jgi:DNA polymerase elongation subunit (family B)
MIISRMNDNKSIYLSWRENGVKKIKIEPTRPYFFVEATHVVPVGSRDVGREYGDWVTLDGIKLRKEYAIDSKEMGKRRRWFSKTWEADVPHHHRYVVDNVKTIPEYKMRKWYWDMEWLPKEHEHSDAITCIVVYDNYDKLYHQWAWCPNGEFDLSMNIDNGNNELYVYDNEKEMIESFINTMIFQDPDMLIAWFGLKFDLPKLLERCCALDIDPFRMSPISRIEGVKKTLKGFSFNIKNGYSPTQQPLGGRITLNLDLAFERQWNDAQRGTLPSLSLEYVSQTLFGEGKLEGSKFDSDEFYSRGWLEDSQIYLEYALKDVELIVRIDETNYTSEAMLALQRVLVAPFDACFYASNMGSIYFMRNAWWKAPTGNKPKNKVCEKCGTKNNLDIKVCTSCKESLSYAGAMIYDPLSENTNGLHQGVAAFDFAALYPSMMIARNISWETKSSEPTEFACNIKMPQDFSSCEEEEWLYYKTDELGLLPRSVLELSELRNKYKANMKEARKNGDKMGIIKWNNNQMAVKRISASFYGILAYRGFGWADVDMAQSITASAREAIREAAFMAKGME